MSRNHRKGVKYFYESETFVSPTLPRSLCREIFLRDKVKWVNQGH